MRSREKVGKQGFQKNAKDLFQQVTNFTELAGKKMLEETYLKTEAIQEIKVVVIETKTEKKTN